MSSRLFGLALLIALAPPGLPGQDELRAAVAAARTRLSINAAEARDLTRLYERAAGAPVWCDATGALTTNARTALALLEQAGTEGLNPADYGVTELARLRAQLDDRPGVRAPLIAELDVQLTASLLRLFRHLHLGRVDPRALGWQIDAPAETHDHVDVLWSALRDSRIAETAASLEPPLHQYAALKAMLARYRALASQAIAAPEFRATVKPGDPLPDAATLQRFLNAVGDLSADATPPTGVYDESLRDAVARFQARHGLDADGLIGSATQAALREPLTVRVRQIELALERLRWLPDLSGGRLIAVNIPTFYLWAFDTVPSSKPPELSMRVIVGRAVNTRTPVFAEQMRYLVFRPYWNVPRSIARNEVVPALRKDADYLDRQNMELVRGESDAAAALSPTPEAIADLEKGAVRVRQRPGPKNALGLVKFMFPNQNNVYLHSTPAPLLFQQARRDFSHGCIRVEDPVALAEWVLARTPGWTRARITTAMDSTPNQRVNLEEPIQVVIFYTTAIVLPQDGTVHFASDLYGNDVKLDAALR